MADSHKTGTKEIWRNSDNFIKRALSFYFHTIAGGIIFWIGIIVAFAVLSIVLTFLGSLG